MFASQIFRRVIKRNMNLYKWGVFFVVNFLTYVLLSTGSVVEAQDPIEVLNIEITTQDEAFARTRDDVALELLIHPSDEPQSEPELRSWRFSNDDNDLFRRGETNTFRLTENLPRYTCEIIRITIRKIVTGFDGLWKLGGLRIYRNDDPSLIIYENSSINHTMYDDDQDWSDYASEEPCPVSLTFEEPHPTPDNCYVEELPDPDSGDLPITHADSDCDGIPDHEDPEPDTPAIDTDQDGIPDPREEIMGTDPNNPDTDGDGIPDSYEDRNRNGVVDPGETDPTIPDAGGNVDSDLDGFPDWFEIDTDPNNPDTDGDGWADGPTNVRTFLLLQQIVCEDEEEDWGHDEFFLVVDDVRFPEDREDIDGRYQLEKGGTADPNIVVARRVRSPSQAANYSAVVEMWEDDSSDNRDDYWQTDIIDFGETGHVVVNRDDDDAIYHVTFWAYSRLFGDPNPTQADGDNDEDGLQDAEELELSAEMNGISDPAYPDIFVEMDWVGAEQEPEPWSKRNVVSQFYYHSYFIHLDDGDFQDLDGNYGGENLAYGGPVYLDSEDGTPSREGIAEDDGHFAANRHGLFHYVVAVDEIGDDGFGNVHGPRQNDSGEIVCTGPGRRVGLQILRSDYLDWTDMESIVFMHELGHALGLCHRPEEGPYPPLVVPAPHCTGNPPPDCSVCRDCSHYWIDPDSDTAMGTGFRGTGLGAAIGGFLGLIIGGAIGYVVGGPVGGIIGAVVGAGLGIFFGGWLLDIIAALDREINFEDAEWEVLELRGIRFW